MERKKMAKLSTEPYKGVRDFYPADMAVQNYIFNVMRKTVESFGYAEYSASILEPAELYRAKSGEEIVNEQTYTFIDRGEREVTLRPEMTPTVARMVAAKKRELSFPLRWYSIPNLFRYERPQRGRLREHWQLNVDLFGAKELEADVEIIQIAHGIMRAYGLDDSKFIIKIGSRNALMSEFIHRKIPPENYKKIQILIDKKGKLPEEERQAKLKALGGDFEISESSDIAEIRRVLERHGVHNTVFDADIVRGFDYYTGMVFEVFDTSPNNNRSLFGGGRYDGLTAIFGEPDMPAVGFGMGDVTIRDVLETYKLIPEGARLSKTSLYIGVLNEQSVAQAQELAVRLREKGLSVATDFSGKKKMDDHNKKAAKDAVPFVLCIGEEEIKSRAYRIKDLATSVVHTVREQDIPGLVLDTRGT